MLELSQERLVNLPGRINNEHTVNHDGFSNIYGTFSEVLPI